MPYFSLRVGVALGGTPLGAPIVGFTADHFGPRWAMSVGAAGGFAAAAVAIYALMHHMIEKPGQPKTSIS